MSSGQAWWAHKEEEYSKLCERFGEKPHTTQGDRGIEFLDSNGKHAERLRKRARKEGSV